MIDIITKCFKHPDSNFSNNKSDKTKYVELEEINYKEEKFSILQYTFYFNNKKITFNNISNITITEHSILFQNIEIYFEYLLRFFDVDKRSVGIKCIGTIDTENKFFKLQDTYMLTLIIFPSVDIKKKFMIKLFEQIKLYKHKDIYDKSILKYNVFLTN